MLKLALILQVNDTITFKLLQRPRDSIIPKEVAFDSHATPGSTPTKEGAEPDNGNPSATPSSSWGSSRERKDNPSSAAAATGQAKNKGEKMSDNKGDKGTNSKLHGRSRGKGHKHDSDEKEDDGKAFNKYAKFTTVGDGKAFWKAAAEELARYAAQVCSTLCMLCLLCCAL